MPTITSNSFTSFSLTDDEQKAGSTLSSLNVAVLQNQLAQIAEEKINLVFTPDSINTFLQQEAYLKGQLDLLNYILAAHEESLQYKTIERN